MVVYMTTNFESLTPSYLIHFPTPVLTSTTIILSKIVIDHPEDYVKILNFTSGIKVLYNTVNKNIRTTYGKFIPDWTLSANFSNFNYSGQKRMLQYIKSVNNMSYKFSQIVNILEKYNDYNNKRNELRQQKVQSMCYGNYHYPYNSLEQIEYFVKHYNPSPQGIFL